MSKRRELVLGAGASSAEDELRLPREPGVIRRFWARHPLFADILLAVIALLLAVPAVTIAAPTPEPPAVRTIVLAIALEVAACVAVVWRRRWPVAVFVVSLVPAMVLDPTLAASLSGPASLIAVYSIAVYRSVRACWIAFGVVCGVVALQTLIRILMGATNIATHINLDVSTLVFLLIGALVGVNVGNRKRYLNALIDRSRQLVIERDQQAQLGAAAERARIAREMHDIVSHSLTVVVALAEGASATTDPERARAANRAAAATAREALSELRSMVGLLRTDDSDRLPLAPVLDVSVSDVVDAARRAGLPVTLTVTGVAEAPPAHLLAARRIVQEAITNSMRYADDPSYVRVATDYHAAGLCIVIENDASRTHAPSVGAGWGLAGLRERVASLGGSFEAGMVAPHIWRVTAELPKEAPDV